MSSANLFNEIQKSVAELIAKYKEATADGKVTFAESTQLVMKGSREVVRITQQLPVVGADKKAAAMEALELFIDQVVTPLDLVAIPNWLEPIIDRQLKSVFLSVADGAIEFVVSLFNQMGWPQEKELPEG